MNQTNTPHAKHLRRLNTWMKVQLIINVVFIAALFLAFRKLGDARYVLIAIGSLAFVGAFLVSLGLTRIGTWLFMLGSVVSIPLGGIGIVGALKLQHDLNDAQTHAALPLEFEETPSYSAFAQNAERLLPIGATLVVLGVFMITLAGAQGMVLVAAGLLNFAFVVGMKSEPAAALFGRYSRFRLSLWRWLYIPYADICEVSPTDDGLLAIRYRQQENESSHVISAGVYGAAQFDTLVTELTKRVPHG